MGPKPLLAFLAAAALPFPGGDGITMRANVGSGGDPGSGHASRPGISSDGRWVVFSSSSGGLAPGDANGDWDVFVHDRTRGLTELVSATPGGSSGNGRSVGSHSSADGRFVAFQSEASDLVAGDVNGVEDAFVRDRLTGATEIVSLGQGGAQVNGPSSCTGISPDGRFVVFVSSADNLVPGDVNGKADVFLRDRLNATTALASLGQGGVLGEELSSGGSVSADGRFVTFYSDATNLVGGDTNGARDVFVRDLQAGLTERVSVAADGGQANGSSYASRHSISADGRFVVFASHADGLVPGDANRVPDVFVRDRQVATTQIVSLAPGGASANAWSEYPTISGNGRFVGFISYASNLHPSDPDFGRDLFLFDRESGQTHLASVSSAGVKVSHSSYSASLVLTPDGQQLAFAADKPGFVPDDTAPLGSDVFVRDISVAPQPARFCLAKTNSLGCVPAVGWTGTPSAGGFDNFRLHATNLRNQQVGLLLWGLGGQAVPFAGGLMCVAAAKRTPAQLSGGSPPPIADCTGSYEFHVSPAFLAANGLGVSDLVYAQFWGRDIGFAPPFASALTQALHWYVQP